MQKYCKKLESFLYCKNSVCLHNSLALLLADTDSAATATGGLGVLTTDTETPVVTETTVRADLLQALEILTELGVDTVGNDLAVLAVGDVALSVEEPGGDLVLGGVLDDGNDTLEFFGGDITSTIFPSVNIPYQPVVQTVVENVPLGEVNIGLFADQVGVTTTNTLDLGQGVHDFLLAIDVGVEQTDNVLEVRLLAGYERCN